MCVCMRVSQLHDLVLVYLAWVESSAVTPARPQMVHGGLYNRHFSVSFLPQLRVKATGKPFRLRSSGDKKHLPAKTRVSLTVCAPSGQTRTCTAYTPQPPPPPGGPETSKIPPTNRRKAEPSSLQRGKGSNLAEFLRNAWMV